MAALSCPVPVGRLSLAVLLAAAMLCVAMPLQVSLAAVAVLAGPHNWLEARYLMTKMPPRWGRLQPFYLVAIAGTLALTVGHIVVRASPLVVWWNVAFAGWLTALAVLRSRQNLRLPWLDWAVPAGLLLAAFGLLTPYAFGVALLLAHPLMALYFFHRSLPPTQRRAIEPVLRLVPIACVGVALFAPIDQAASHLTLPPDQLIGVHAFLELLHYAAWIIGIPLASRAWSVRRVDDIPLRRRATYWPRVLRGVLVVGLAAIVVLWIGFAVDPVLTREVYFTLAIVHVLAELPFALRAA